MGHSSVNQTTGMLGKHNGKYNQKNACLYIYNRRVGAFGRLCIRQHHRAVGWGCGVGFLVDCTELFKISQSNEEARGRTVSVIPAPVLIGWRSDNINGEISCLLQSPMTTAMTFYTNAD